MSQSDLDRFLIWFVGGIAAVVWFIARSIAREIWLLVKVPFEIIYSFYQMMVALTELQEQLQIWQYAMEIINNLTSQPLIHGIIDSVSPFAGLIWLLFGGYSIYKILLPALIDAL